RRGWRRAALRGAAAGPGERRAHVPGAHEGERRQGQGVPRDVGTRARSWRVLLAWARTAPDRELGMGELRDPLLPEREGCARRSRQAERRVRGRRWHRLDEGRGAAPGAARV